MGEDPAVSAGRGREPFRARLHGDVLAAIALGGVLGGTARYALELAFAAPAGTFPLTTWAVNVSGAFLLALLNGAVLERPQPPRLLRPFAGVGFLGAYTTFSTWMVDTDRLLADGHHLTAALNLFCSLLAGATVTVAGLFLGRRVRARGRHGTRSGNGALDRHRRTR